PIIDEQHRGIVATLNSLHYFIQQGYGLEALQPTLQIIGQYIGFHLKTEENILNKCNYLNIDKNSDMQKEIYCNFKKIAKEATAYKDPELLLKFIKNWWLNHIKEEHKEYSKYLKDYSN
ncbi:MAG: hemerythrin family protein, partial [Methylococcales bacterium]|nr:hemerythrin family protein [Methylococcales bacterium]